MGRIRVMLFLILVGAKGSINKHNSSCHCIYLPLTSVKSTMF